MALAEFHLPIVRQFVERMVGVEGCRPLRDPLSSRACHLELRRSVGSRSFVVRRTEDVARILVLQEETDFRWADDDQTAQNDIAWPYRDRGHDSLSLAVIPGPALPPSVYALLRFDLRIDFNVTG